MLSFFARFLVVFNFFSSLVTIEVSNYLRDEDQVLTAAFPGFHPLGPFFFKFVLALMSKLLLLNLLIFPLILDILADVSVAGNYMLLIYFTLQIYKLLCYVFLFFFTSIILISFNLYFQTSKIVFSISFFHSSYFFFLNCLSFL